MKSPLVFTALTLALSSPTFAQGPSQDTWREILAPPQDAPPPAAPGKVTWRTDLPAALAEARAANRPLLVTWRCLPCKQCAAFDQDVLEGGPELSPLLTQFVTVRMTDAAQLDERYFPFRGYQDLDLSWWGYFLSPEGRLYGVFGGKDHISDTTRISTAAFANTMRRILAHHRDPRRAKWATIDGAVPEAAAPATTPRQFASFDAFQHDRPGLQKQDCLHCHQVNDLLHFDAMQRGEFKLTAYTQAWPLPENVGLHLDRDHGLLVTKVVAHSPAAAAGLAPGDQLVMAAARRLHSQADFRGALHRADYGPATIPLAWTRAGEVHFATLRTAENWRAGENAWRKSVYEGIVGPHLGFFPLPGPGHGKGAMSLRPFMGSGENQKDNAWFPTGLRPDMEIVEVNGRRDDWDSRQFLAWFRLNHNPGDTVNVVTRDGKKFAHVLPEDP